ncbi:MAG: hypothetical protein HDT24_06240 [Ruminococcus sp.]|nr:hypothetical protein [Ruminococcus sp.]
MKRKIIAVGICAAIIAGFGGCTKGGEEAQTEINTAATTAAEPEYALDFDTAVSNIIAAGVEADSSEFVLLGITEDSDGEAYYNIIKGYDIGEAVSTEEIFRVNTENGSVYVYFDPTLPMSDYLAQFKSENDENDPQSRYIQIYGGTS